MKKYLLISLVLGSFGVLFFLRQLKGSDAPPVVGNQSTNTNSLQNTSSTGSSSGAKYKDGTYTGPVTDAFYGNVQVQVTISGGRLTDVEFLQHPNDNRTSESINSQAMPMLKQEALTAQSAQVDVVSGASQTSAAFQQSLSSALQQAS